MRRTLYILALVLLPCISGAQALPFTAVNHDPVSMAKGGTYMTETATSAYAAFGNPASLSFSEKHIAAALGFTMWQPASVGSNVLNAAGSCKLNEKLGVALGLSYGMNPAYDIIDASGKVTGVFKPSDMQFNAGVSWLLLPYLSLGANLGYASSKLAEGASYGAVNADIFAMAKLDEMTFAAGIKGLGTSVESASGTSFDLPTAITAGCGYGLSGEHYRVDLNVDAEYYMKGGAAVAAGVSCTLAEITTLRAGYRYGGKTVLPSFASMGFGLNLSGMQLDIAYLLAGKDSPMANTACLSLGYSF